jgi:Peptidase A4 family
MATSRMKLIETELVGHFFVAPPPKNFQPLKATDEELERYGLPHRPDPKKLPKASRLWLRSMRAIREFVQPKLIRLQKTVHVRPKSIDGNTSSIWSGLIISNPNTSYFTVWGTWTVPSVLAGLGGTGDFVSSIWVGLNGDSLLQAGTEQDVSVSPSLFFGGSSYYAWFEWFPANTVQLDGFSVSPGQTVVVSISPMSGTEGGLISFLNISTGVASSPLFAPIPTADFNGNPIEPPITGIPSDSAVFILERPATSVQNGVPVAGALANYGEAVMPSAGAVATTSDGAKSDTNTPVTVGENDQGTLLNMLADDGVTVLSTAQEEPALTFQYAPGAQV